MANMEGSVKALRVVLKDKHQIHVPEECDEFIKRCLRLKDFDEEKALKLVKLFRDMIKRVRSWDAKLQPTLYTRLYNTSCADAMPELDSLGRRIFVLIPGKWDPSELNFDAALMAIWCSGQYATYEFVETQRNGVVLILDFREFTLQQALHVKTRRLLDGVVWLQSAVFARIKGFHIIFHPKIVNVIYLTIRPFLKEKLKSRIHFHHDVADLHKHVGPRLLPNSLGGNASSGEDFYDKEFRKGLLQQDQFFQGEQTYRSTRSSFSCAM